jgi:hypothetical protein
MRTNDGFLMGNGDVIFSTMGIVEQNHRGKIWFWDQISKPVSIIENLSIPNMPIALEAESTILFADSESGSIFSAQYSSFTERLSQIKELNHLESSWGYRMEVLLITQGASGIVVGALGYCCSSQYLVNY